MGQSSDYAGAPNLTTLNHKAYEDLLMVSSPAQLRQSMEVDEYRQFMRRVNLRPIRSLSDDLAEAVETDDVDYLDAVLRSLAYPVWHQAITLTEPALGDTFIEDTRVLRTLAVTIDRAAERGLGCVLKSAHLWKIDAAVRYASEHRERLLDLAFGAGQREWVERLEGLTPYDFSPADAEGSAWRLAALEDRMVADERHGIDRIMANQQYREELEAIARHIPGHRTDNADILENQRTLAELALALGYHISGRTIGMAVPAELTVVAPDYIVTSEATGKTIHGDPVVNLYLSETACEGPRGLKPTELRQWGKLIARNVAYTDAPRQAATVLRQRFRINRFGIAPFGSAVVIVHNTDDRGLPDEGRPLVNSDTPEKLFGKSVDQLLEQSADCAGKPRSEGEMFLLGEALAALAELGRSPTHKSHHEPNYEAQARSLIEECAIEFAAVSNQDGSALRLKLHPHELRYSPITLIRCSLVNQIAAPGNPHSKRWAGIVWQQTRRWAALSAA